MTCMHLEVMCTIYEVSILLIVRSSSSKTESAHIIRIIETVSRRNILGGQGVKSFPTGFTGSESTPLSPHLGHSGGLLSSLSLCPIWGPELREEKDRQPDWSQGNIYRPCCVLFLPKEAEQALKLSFSSEP